MRVYAVLGFADAFRRLLRNRHQFDAECLLRVVVFNRLCDPESTLGILRWLEGTRVPEVSAESVIHQTCCARWILWRTAATE
jgi:hypothetical protein